MCLIFSPVEAASHSRGRCGACRYLILFAQLLHTRHTNSKGVGEDACMLRPLLGYCDRSPGAGPRPAGFVRVIEPSNLIIFTSHVEVPRVNEADRPLTLGTVRKYSTDARSTRGGDLLSFCTRTAVVHTFSLMSASRSKSYLE